MYIDYLYSMRKLILTESQIKNVIGNLIDEQTQVVAGTSKKTDINTFPLTPLGDQFDYGQYESEKVKNFILAQLKPKIDDFIKNSDSSQFTIKITAGESNVTNPKGFEQKGSLALARANSVKNYFEEIFSDLIKKGVIKIESPTNVSQVQLGKTPYTKGDQNKPDLIVKYKKEQFVNFEILGSGTKTTTTTKYKFLCNTKPKQSSGKFLMSDQDFTQITDWELGKGEGKVSITFDTMTQPDILYFEYNGKTYGDSYFHGNPSDAYRIFVGTSLRAKYGNGALPEQMRNNTIIPLTSDDQKIWKSLDEMRPWKLKDSFENTFGSKSTLFNQQFMSAFEEFDAKGNKRKLIKSLGDQFPWGYLNSEVGPGVVKIGPIDKIDGVDIIKIINVAPVGTTGWGVWLQCESPK